MNLRQLGKSKLFISSIGLGTWQFSQAKGFHKFFWSDISQETMNEIIKTAYDNGINWFDTAELYGSGRSERALSLALHHNNISSNVVIATKWSPIMRRASSIVKTFPKRAENLNPYQIDLHQIHNPYSLSSIKDQLQKMYELQQQGQIKAIGVSNFSASKMADSYAFLEKKGSNLASNQVKFSIFDRSIEAQGVIIKAQELKVTIIAYSPLGQGLATGIYHKNQDLVKNLPLIRKKRISKHLTKTRKAINELDLIANELHCSIAQVSLNWIINQFGETVVAIPGASKVSQANSNALAMKINLSREQLNTIDELTQDFL